MIEPLEEATSDNYPLDDINMVIKKVNEVIKKVNALDNFCSTYGIEEFMDARRVIE